METVPLIFQHTLDAESLPDETHRICKVSALKVEQCGVNVRQQVPPATAPPNVESALDAEVLRCRTQGICKVPLLMRRDGATSRVPAENAAVPYLRNTSGHDWKDLPGGKDQVFCERRGFFFCNTTGT